MNGMILLQVLVGINMGIFMGVFTLLLSPDPLLEVARSTLSRSLPLSSSREVERAAHMLVRVVAWAGCVVLFVSATFTGFVVALFRNGHLKLF